MSLEEMNVQEGADAAPENVETSELVDNENQSDDAVDEASNTEEENNDSNANSGDEWPSTARTAVRNRERKIAKLHAQLREAQAAAQQYQQPQQQQQPKDNGAPKEDDFDDYASYLEAKIYHKIKSEQQGAQQQQPNTQQTVQEQMYLAQKEQLMAQKSAEYAKSIPDYQQVMQESVEMLSYLPPEVQRVFFDADDAALATYNLAKNGRLADLIEMTPTQVAMTIAQAQMKPQMQPPPQPKHKTMQGAKGTSQVRSEDSLSGKELLNKYNVY